MLQVRVLEALAGVHLAHRETRDLDLFWRDRDALDDVARGVERRLLAVSLDVVRLQSSAAFVRLRVTDQTAVVRVDLIAEPGGALETAQPHRIGSVQILVDSRQAILTEKVCALLSRSELRDLIDVKALVESGEDLGRAIAAAPRRDSGFSPLTLAWVLRELDVNGMAAVAGIGEKAANDLDTFRTQLIARLVTPLP